MAIQTIHKLIDDIDQSEAVETVKFALDGVDYQIDLNEDHARELRAALTPWINSGRRIRTVRNASRRGHASNGEVRHLDLKKVRAWARSAGHVVSDRGRVATEVLRAYEAAHPTRSS